jgi:peptide/nickel transport system substrate-binding protein
MTPIRSASCLAVPLVLTLSGTAVAEDRLTFLETVGVEANWQLHSDDSYIASRAGCYEMLTRISPEIEVEPMLATSWSQTSPTTWEFVLREGVMFQDGTPLTAEAVAASLNFLLDAPVPARAFSKEIVSKVEATGPMTVTITTLEPVATLPGRLAAPATTILSPAAYKDGNINVVGTCTGPFEITAVDAQQGITTEAFQDYWGGPAKLAGAHVRFIPDSNTRATMIRSGEAQIARIVPPYTVAQLEGDDSLTIQEVKAPRMVELLLNNGRPPFNDERVRQAVKLAIDTAGISGAIYEGMAPAAGSPFRAGEPWTPADAPAVTADLASAKALLEEAGVEPGSLQLELLAYTARKELGDIAEVVQAMLGELGITVNVRLAEYTAIEPDLLSGNYDMALLSRGYLTDAPEPAGFLSADYSCDGSYNISQFCNAEIDAKLTQISAEPDAAKRASGYAEVAQQLYDQAVTIWLVNEPIFDIAAASVEGYAPHPLNYYALTTEVGLK